MATKSVTWGSWSRLMGAVNAVQRLCDDVWGAGADPRRSSYAVAAGQRPVAVKICTTGSVRCTR